MDRLGRLMTDYSPHLMNQVNEFNEDLWEFWVDDGESHLDSIWEESSQDSSESAYSDGELDD